MVIKKATAQLYSEYEEKMKKIADLRFSAAVLQWDQETYLPPKGAAFRGRQLATLTELAHHYFVDEANGSLLKELAERNDLTNTQRKNVELSLYDYSRQTRFTSEFVRKMTETINRSFHSWISARRDNNFQIFSTDLEELVGLKKQEAEFLGYEGHPYNALLNEFDKGSNVLLLDKVFAEIRQPLMELLDKVFAAKQVDDSLLKKFFPKDRQWDFGLKLLRKLGYDFEAGRQDLSEHPFTTNFNSHDVRITTRIDESDLGNMTWSCIHEAGHALYEQGLLDQAYGLPLGEAASLSIHESQSRLWENHIGRSFAFCENFLPLLAEYFPEQLAGCSPGQLYEAINKVQASFIRTEADELTYHFHVMIRYELEKLLMEGSLPVSEIPAYWNDHYHRYLGIKVADDKTGCLQDVHWSHGSFGYFPTYSLGSFYAAQFFAKAVESDPLIEAGMKNADYKPLLTWLRENIHQHGRMYESNELCTRITGEGLNIRYFIDYAQEKYRKIYNL